MSLAQQSPRGSSAPAPGPRSGAQPGDAARPPRSRLRWKLIVDPPEQLRGSMLGVAVVVGLLLVINLALYLRRGLTISGFGYADAEVVASLERANSADAVFTLACSLAFLGVFALARLIETHRVDGPVVGLVRRIEELKAGRYRGIVQLRRHDRLSRVADSINELSIALKEQARRECKDLEDLAVRARRIDSKYAAKDLSELILRHAAEKRRVYE
jgi:hypothetical protein